MSVQPPAHRTRALLVMPWDLRPIGGVDGVVRNLHQQIARYGRWEPLLLVQSWEDRRPVWVTEDGVRRVRMRLRGPLEGNSALRALTSYLVALPRELRKVVSLVRTNRVGVVNAHYPTFGMVNVALARRFGLVSPRLVLSLHGSDIRNAATAAPLQRALWRWLLGEADAVVAVSQGLAAEAVAFAPDVKTRLHVVHNGIDPDGFTALAGAVGPSPAAGGNRRVLLSVGAFEYKKGHDVLLRAFSAVAQRHPDLDLVLLGQTGAQLEAIEDLVAKLGLGGRCTLLRDASREVVATWMSVATAFVLASRAEPFGLVFLEAGAFGLPVIGPRVGGVPEIISDPECGVLVPPEDPEALSAAIDRVLSDPDAAAQMGSRLQHRVRTAFSWQQAYLKYEPLFAGSRGPCKGDECP